MVCFESLLSFTRKVLYPNYRRNEMLRRRRLATHRMDRSKPNQSSHKKENKYKESPFKQPIFNATMNISSKTVTIFFLALLLDSAPSVLGNMEVHIKNKLPDTVEGGYAVSCDNIFYSAGEDKGSFGYHIDPDKADVRMPHNEECKVHKSFRDDC